MNTYVLAPESVLGLAEELIAEFHPWLKACKIGFVMFEGEKLSQGRQVVGKVTKVTPKMQPVMTEELDFIIELSAEYYGRVEEARRRAVIDHELCHIRLSKDSGYRTQGHDVEEFVEIVERYGLWTHDLLAAGGAFAKHAPAEQMQLPLEGQQQQGKVVAIEVKSFMGAEG